MHGYNLYFVITKIKLKYNTATNNTHTLSRSNNVIVSINGMIVELGTVVAVSITIGIL